MVNLRCTQINFGDYKQGLPLAVLAITQNVRRAAEGSPYKNIRNMTFYSEN